MAMVDATGVLPGMENFGDNFVHPGAMLHLCKNKRAGTTHLASGTLHHSQIRTYGRRQISFVDDQQVGLSNSWPTFARNFVATGNVNDIDGEVGKFAAEVRGQIIASGFEKEDVR